MKKLGLISIFSLFFYFSYSQSPEWILGNWDGEGSLFNQPAKFQMTWTDQWKGKFLKLEFSNKIIDSQYPKFEVEAYYHPIDGNRYKGYWFDSRGWFVEVGSKFNTETNTLTSVWGSPETEQGKTIYQFQSDGTIAVEDYVLRNNGYELFGKATYQKSE